MEKRDDLITSQELITIGEKLTLSIATVASKLLRNINSSLDKKEHQHETKEN